MLIDRTLSSISPSLTQNRDKEGRRRRGGTPVELASSTRFLPVCVQTQLSTDSTPRKQKASKIDFSKNSLAAIIIHKKHSNCSAQSEDTGSDGNLFKQWMKGEFPWFCFPYLGCLGQFKIGICQLTVTGDKSTKACNSVKVATSQGASLLLLPEMWNCPYSHAHFSEFAEDFNDKDGSPTFSMLSEVASCLGVTVVAGSIPERSSNLLYNTCCVFGPDGRLKAKHRKLGEIIATSGHGETILIAEIDYSASQLTKKSLPLDRQRREDVYQFIDLQNKRCEDACKFTGSHKERD